MNMKKLQKAVYDYENMFRVAPMTCEFSGIFHV